MPSKKSFPKRERFTDKMPAIKIEDVTKTHVAGSKQPPSAAATDDDKFKALHERFDTLEALIRERLNVHEDRLDVHDQDIADTKAQIADLKTAVGVHEKRLIDLERKARP